MDGLLTKSSKDNAQIDLLVIGGKEEMNAYKKYLYLIATNRIETMDPAVLRPGRFDERIYIPLPNDEVNI